jgi:hypothetical protein
MAERRSFTGSGEARICREKAERDKWTLVSTYKHARLLSRLRPAVTGSDPRLAKRRLAKSFLGGTFIR